MVFFDHTKYRTKIEKYKAMGYMTAPEVARAHDVSPTTVRSKMGDPDKTIMNPTPVYLYLRTRVNDVVKITSEVKK